MKINYLTGNAIEPVGDGIKVIAHIVNDAGGFGAGFVMALNNKWPSHGPKHWYKEWYKQGKWNGKDFVLGQIQTIQVEKDIFVCNMIAQRDFKRLEENGTILDIPNCNLTSLRECLIRLRIHCENLGIKVSIHMPRIGCGLGGESWDRVERVIDSVFEHSSLPVFVYDYEFSLESIRKNKSN
jgi:O-acetyl-ADP-ribose deacetylase (regulator of RNase III)